MNDSEDKDLHHQLFYDNSSDLQPHKRKGLFRSSGNNIISGVCGGIAEYSHLDASSIRVIAILSLLLGGWNIMVYLILALLLPLQKNTVPLSQEYIQKVQKENFKTVLSGFMLLIGIHFALVQAGIFSNLPFLGFSNGISLSFFVIGLGFILLVNSKTPNKVLPSLPNMFYRSKNDKIFSGICGGLAQYINLDSSSLRFIFILLTGLTLGMFAIGYLILAFNSSFEKEITQEIYE